MTILPPLKWDTVPGCSSYKASTHGEVWSVDRDLPDGRHRTGQRIRTRPNNSGYELINMTNDQGKRITMTLHSVILTAFDGECPPGQTARHLDDNPQHNTWAPGATAEDRIAAGGNLMWGTWPEQVADGYRNGGRVPAAPKPLKYCILCGNVFETLGRRCPDCLSKIGEGAAGMLQAGATLGEACERLGYPSAEGLHKLAVKYGGYGARPPARAPWLRRVTASVAATVRDRFRRGPR